MNRGVEAKKEEPIELEGTLQHFRLRTASHHQLNDLFQFYRNVLIDRYIYIYIALMIVFYNRSLEEYYARFRLLRLYNSILPVVTANYDD